jgi:hypothetical protein
MCDDTVCSGQNAPQRRTCAVLIKSFSFDRTSELFQFDEGLFGVPPCGAFVCRQNSMIPCKYGADCYRKNPDHLKKFSHPPKDAAQPQKAPPSPKAASPKSSPGKKKVCVCFCFCFFFFFSSFFLSFCPECARFELDLPGSSVKCLELSQGSRSLLFHGGHDEFRRV